MHLAQSKLIKQRKSRAFYAEMLPIACLITDRSLFPFVRTNNNASAFIFLFAKETFVFIFYIKPKKLGFNIGFPNSGTKYREHIYDFPF